MRISCMILALTMMSGCSVLSKQPIEQKIEVSPPQIVEVAVDDDICLFTSEPENFDYNCDMAWKFGLKLMLRLGLNAKRN